MRNEREDFLHLTKKAFVEKKKIEFRYLFLSYSTSEMIIDRIMERKQGEYQIESLIYLTNIFFPRKEKELL